MDTRPASAWFTAITCSSLVALAAGAGIYRLYTEMLAHEAVLLQAQKDVVGAYATRLGNVENKLAALEQAQSELAHPDTTPIDTLNSQLSESKEQVAALTARIEELEKKPAPVPQPTPMTVPTKTGKDPLSALNSAVRSGKPFAEELAAVEDAYPKNPSLVGLRSIAVQGVPTDEMLRASLQEKLDHVARPTEPVAEDSLLGKLNAKFSGFISVKKQSSYDVYATVKRDVATADINALAHDVEALPEEARVSFKDWLAQVRTQRDAYVALDSLTPAPGR